MTRRAFPMRKMVRGNGRVLWKGREREEQECSCYLAVLLLHACDVPTQSKPTTPSGADKTHCNKTRSTTI
uniref:Uncharacterized protein n=1 Tax=Colletotrichum scovillei TaxID=1209932 RepID=A0A9P7RB38_9PEZI